MSEQQQQQQQQSSTADTTTNSNTMVTVNEIVQFIDHAGEIVKEKDNDQKKTFLSHLSDKSDFLTKGFDYSVISILGPQSSGKSTLLNLLFNTKFAVMEGKKGRSQTTQGVWMGVASIDSSETYLILDVEGTDGRERGEDEKAFERKTSLFSLVLSSVLIINMWAHDIGRYTASNMSLLKNVFELNLQLFQKKKTHKTLILFVIRDNDDATPMFELQKTVLEDIDKLWREISKPQEFLDTNATQFFDFDFFSLPHKNIQPTQFLEQASVLKGRFLDNSHSNFIPKKIYRNEDVPADGLYQYSNNVWETIKSNRDLDLPTQKEMLALYRCDEFVEQTFTQFTTDLKSIRERIEKGKIIDDFGQLGKKLIDAALDRYDQPAQRYHQDTVAKKRQTLRERLFSELKKLFEKQIEKLFDRSIEFYNSLVQETTNVKPSTPTSSSSSSANSDQKKVDNSQIIPQFTIWAKNMKQKSIEYFEKTAASSIVEGSEWEYSEYSSNLDERITKEIQTLRENQINKLSKLMKDMTIQQLNPHLIKITERANENMWEDIRSIYKKSLENIEGEYLIRLKDFDVKENEIEEIIGKFKESIRSLLKSKMVERAEFLPMKLRKRFEENFNMDSRKLPRKWTKSDDISSVFRDARNNSEKLIDLFSFLRLDDGDNDVEYFKHTANDDHEENLSLIDQTDKIIISYKDCSTLCENFRRDIKSDYNQACSEQSRLSASTGLSPTLILLLCVLGFNEFIAIISSPLLLFFTIILGIVGFVLYKLGLSAPVIDFISQFLVHFISKVKDVLLHVEHLTNEGGDNSSVSPKDIKMKKLKTN
ncbi:hypothetical protein DLAC_03519 [Tieghemostelium lacteum]|uniref:Protein SEY1 homolog n=1 Tax=Tieghemostelium lacteum TaxID=361077 RepID=A0A152A197_TIELA|nr:hypothetical protein DLAC_03519 [Tieghemostelium lacteum]|eukprot:KYR00022.1 hypothetical protein DLAC_03519 [Tieghemostelium lacteum]